MNNNFNCKFCNRTFSGASNLKTHTKTAKFCLKIQSSLDPSRSIEQFCVKCEFCSQEFTQKKTLTKHICFEKMEFDYNQKLAIKDNELKIKNIAFSNLEKSFKESQLKNKQLVNENLKLEKELAFEKGCMAGYEKVKPKTIINNNNKNKTYINPKLLKVCVDNIRPLTIQTIENDLYKYTYEAFTKEVQGIIDFIISVIIFEQGKNAIERSYVCTDKSRNTYHRLIEQKEWYLDNGASFINNFLNSVQPLADDYMEKFREKEKSIGEGVHKGIYKDKLITLEDFHCGIMNRDGKCRDNIFNEVRNGIRDKASI